MKIVKEGFPFIIINILAGLIFIVIQLIIGLGHVFFGLGVLFLLLAAFCIYFFRDPKIKIITNENTVLSPCNGKIMEINENSDENIIRVFLSIFDVHLQRSPVNGAVTSVEHKSGEFLMAMRPEAHSVNEQNIIHITNETGTFVVRQIAGFIARRCIAWIKAGYTVKMGDKIGLIKFGSQVDLHMPKSIKIQVKTGGRVRAGITVVGIKNE